MFAMQSHGVLCKSGSTQLHSAGFMMKALVSEMSGGTLADSQIQLPTTRHERHRHRLRGRQALRRTSIQSNRSTLIASNV